MHLDRRVSALLARGGTVDPYGLLGPVDRRVGGEVDVRRTRAGRRDHESMIKRVAASGTHHSDPVP
jgi:hypothetical protein